jgi:hypothetical protein
MPLCEFERIHARDTFAIFAETQLNRSFNSVIFFFDSVCQTTKGSFEIEVYRDWSPNGADRFIDLVNDGFYTDIAMYRSVEGFLTQFGISDNPEQAHWHDETIEDDPNLSKGRRIF